MERSACRGANILREFEITVTDVISTKTQKHERTSRLAERVWLAKDFLTPPQRVAVIQHAEGVGFVSARLSAQGRQNSEVFLRRDDIRNWVLGGLRRILGPADVPGMFECYRYRSGAAVASHADA